MCRSFPLDDLFFRADDLYYLYYLYDLAHIAGWERYNVHDPPQPPLTAAGDGRDLTAVDGPLRMRKEILRRD